MATEKAAKEGSSSSRAVISSHFLPFLRWSMRSESPVQSRFPALARRGWSAQDFSAQNIRCVSERALLCVLSRSTYDSQLWKSCLMLDETAHAYRSQFFLHPTGAVRPS